MENWYSGKADALSRAESAELGCEIAYRREPTQAEGDAHELPPGKGAITECHVPMGDHHGHRCRCGAWVWGGPTVCQRCVASDVVACVQAQRDILLDVSAEGSWLAWALNAERELATVRADLEIAESRKSAVIQRLSAFARECRDNWDCDTDAHTHGTMCRACEARRVLTHGEETR